MRRIYRSMLMLCKKQNGAVKILVALSMFMIIGFTAFVVDAGGLYFEKSRLQKSLDAAVLGGAQLLKVSEERAKEVAMNLALKNGFSVSEVDVGADFIEMEKTVNKELFFARILGFDNANVSAIARAELVQTLVEGDGIIPVALEQGEYEEGASYTMHFQPGNGNNKPKGGNFGFLGIDGDGGDVLREAIKNGSKRSVLEEYEWTEPGLMWGPVKQGFQYRIDQDVGKPHCQNYETADNTCSRVVTVPIVKEFISGGKNMVKIIGFASFWIESPIGNHEIKGRFIDSVEGGTFGDEGEDFGVYGVKLVK